MTNKSAFPGASRAFVILGRLILLLGLPFSLVALDGPLSPEDLFDLARENSPALLILTREEARSRHEVLRARAMKGPALSYSASYSFLGFPPEGITLSPGELGIIPDLDGPGPAAPILLPGEETVFVEDTDRHYYRLGLTLTQPLYTWGRLDGALRAARIGEQAGAAAREGGEALLRAELNSLVYSLALTESMEEDLRRQEEILPRLVRLTEKGVDQGFLLDRDLLEIRITAREVALARREVENRKAGLLDRLEELTGLTGLDPEHLILPDPAGERPLPPEEELLAGLGTNPDLRQLALAEEAKGELALIASREKTALPDLGFRFSLEYARDALPFSGEEWSSGFSATASLSLQGSLPIGGGERAEWELARDDRALAALRYEEALLTLRGDVKSALRERELLLLKVEAERLRGEKLAREIGINKDLWQSGAAGEEEPLKKELEYRRSVLTLKGSLAEYHNLTDRILYLTGGYP